MDDEQPGDVACMCILVLCCQARGSLLHHFCPQPCSPQVSYQGHSLLQQSPSPLCAHQHICLQAALLLSLLLMAASGLVQSNIGACTALPAVMSWNAGDTVQCRKA